MDLSFWKVYSFSAPERCVEQSQAHASWGGVSVHGSVDFLSESQALVRKQTVLHDCAECVALYQAQVSNTEESLCPFLGACCAVLIQNMEAHTQNTESIDREFH